MPVISACHEDESPIARPKTCERARSIRSDCWGTNCRPACYREDFEEAATPWEFRCTAAHSESPRQFTLENRRRSWFFRNPAALRHLAHALGALCLNSIELASAKHYSIVNNLWTARLSCGNQRKIRKRQMQGCARASCAGYKRGQTTMTAMRIPLWLKIGWTVWVFVWGPLC